MSLSGVVPWAESYKSEHPSRTPMGAKGMAKTVASGLQFFELERDGRAHVTDQEGLRKEGIDLLVRDAVFGDAATQAQARYLVWQASQELGALTASIQGLYEAR